MADLSLTPEAWKQVDQACDAFEAAWKAGQNPDLEGWLAAAVPGSALRKKLFQQLLVLEDKYRRLHGEHPSQEEYRRRFAEDFAGLPEPSTAAHRDTSAIKDEHAAGAADWPQIAGYEIVAELGRGGMGVVYKARQSLPRRLVAIKMIRDGALADPDHIKRFDIEIETAARCQHPNLVRIFEVGKHKGLPYFSMEFAEGGSLDKKLARQPQPLCDAARLLRTLAEAVHYAHEKNIVHRDLKPANVVLTADGRPLITDFGLAKRLDPGLSTVSYSEQVLGTFGYMAPEVVAGQAKYVGPAVDIYALGAILYEMLTGAPPFLGAKRQDMLDQEPAPPTLLRAEVPADLETICLKCLEKNPEQRYNSARDLAEDLQNFLDNKSIIAAPISEEMRLARWALRAGFEIEDVMTFGVRDFVYKARDIHLNRTVALKVIAPPAQADPTALARLRQEAKTVALLFHPNIVGIHSLGDLHGRTYLAFEYVDGGSLIERFGDRPVPAPEAARLIQQLAEAMAYTHQRGILHCALKPSNVLLTADGVPKIANFGLSVLMEQPSTAQSLAFRRLPSYMAPELMDEQAVGPAADVYSLGAILFKLLTGGPPFLADTVLKTVEQVRSQLPPVPSTVRPDVPAFLDAVCLKCLAKKPGERYASAADLANEMIRFLAGASSIQSVPPFPYPT